MPRNIAFDQLAVKISAASVVVDGVFEAVLEKAAIKVKETAEQKFGSYQSSTGPFSGWSALSSEYLADKIAAGGSESPLIGVPSMNHIYGTPLKDTIEYTIRPRIAYIGTSDPLGKWMEYGLPNRKTYLPPRAFLRPALFQNREIIVKDIKTAIDLALVDYFK